MGFVEKIETRRWVEYLEALEEERKKIEIFQRELPLCLELVTHTIECCKQQLTASDDEICGEVPVLEEYRSLTPEEEEEEKWHENQNASDDDEEAKEQNKDQHKLDWLKSVQLSIQQSNRSDEEDDESKSKKSITIGLKKTTGAFHPFHRDESKSKKSITIGLKKTTGAFHPFHRDRKLSLTTVPPPPPTPLQPVACGSSTAETSSGGSGNNDNSHRKTRRCWSPELHRRFLLSLHELGGSKVATPKQIRELMKVDGLTNDEVKSHLQKYRLHTRRPGQVVTGNGIWVPPQPPDFATTVVSQPVTDDNSTASAPTKKIYAPVASLPSSSWCNNGKNEFIGEDDRANSSSPATSKSSRTNTTSPAKIMI